MPDPLFAELQELYAQREVDAVVEGEEGYGDVVDDYKTYGEDGDDDGVLPPQGGLATDHCHDGLDEAVREREWFMDYEEPMWGRFMRDKYPEDFVNDDDFGNTCSGSDEELGSEPEWPSGSDVSVADDDEASSVWGGASPGGSEGNRDSVGSSVWDNLDLGSDRMVDARSDVASSQVSWGSQLSIGAPVLDMSHLVELKKNLRDLDAEMRARGLAESAAKSAAAAVPATPVATQDDSRTRGDQQTATGAPRDVAAASRPNSSRQTTGARTTSAARPGDDGAASSCGCKDCAIFEDLVGACGDLLLPVGRQVTFTWARNSCHYDAALEFLYVLLLATQTATRSGLRSLLSRPAGVAHGAACKIGVELFNAMAAAAREDGIGMTAAREKLRKLLDPTMARQAGSMQCALEDVEHMMGAGRVNSKYGPLQRLLRLSRTLSLRAVAHATSSHG
eukprot:jgi/Mesvir1/26235/Mv02411-RA.1